MNLRNAGRIILGVIAAIVTLRLMWHEIRLINTSPSVVITPSSEIYPNLEVENLRGNYPSDNNRGPQPPDPTNRQGPPPRQVETKVERIDVQSVYDMNRSPTVNQHWSETSQQVPQPIPQGVAETPASLDNSVVVTSQQPSPIESTGPRVIDILDLAPVGEDSPDIAPNQSELPTVFDLIKTLTANKNKSPEKEKPKSLPPAAPFAAIASTAQYFSSLSTSSASAASGSRLEELLSSNKPAFADVRGNLGPARVVTKESMSNWLQDRWQASADLRGIPLPGKHWVMMDLERKCYVTRFVIDWEEGYSHDFAIYGREDPIACSNGDKLCEDVGYGWVKIVDSYDLKKRKALTPYFSPKHVLMHFEVTRSDGGVEADANAIVRIDAERVRTDAVGPFQSLKMIIRRPAGKWGVSIWRWQAWGAPI